MKRLLINWRKFPFAVIISVLDSGFTHGYHLRSFRSIREPVKNWLFINSRLRKSVSDNTGKEPLNDFFAGGDFLTFLDATFPIGGVIGSCLIVYFANKFGRKGGMLMAAFISIFGSLFVGYSKFFDTPVLIGLGRFLMGIKAGINSGLAPMYLAEIAPQKIRGLVGSMYGIVLSYGIVIGVVAEVFANNTHWPLVESVVVLMTIMQLILFPLCPESPKYLYVIKKNERECRKALKWLRGDKYKEEEVKKLLHEYHQRRTMGEIQLRFMLSNAILRNALITSTILTISQQVCGVSTLRAYTHKFLLQNKHVTNINYSTMFELFKAGLTISVFFLIEKFSRKTMYLVSFIGMALLSILACILINVPDFSMRDEIVIALSLGFLLVYKVGTGVLSWFAASEYFNTSAAPIAYSIGAGINWFIRAILLVYAEPLYSVLKGYGFLNYFVINIALAYYTYTRVVDTRNKSIKEVYQNIYLIITKK